jgi:ubiquinone/menaquinone biosynthesis C-methylase UbiE
MASTHRAFIPAATYDWLLPLYDPISKLTGSEAAQRQLIEQAGLRPGQRVLEIGCGTGSVVVLIKSLYPSVDVAGLDPDAKALARAQRKVERLGASIQLDRGFADELPYRDQTYDRVLSSFMFHHLTMEEKRATVEEIRRVLKPQGSFHLLDFGADSNDRGRLLTRLFHEHVKNNSPDTILGLMRAARFSDAAQVADRRGFFFRVFYYRASAGP